MADNTKIEWSDATWNYVTGCTKVSPGCDHCYAETFAERWRGTAGHHFEQGFDIRLWPDRLDLPLRWRKPRKIFVNSMSDVFHEAVPDDFIARMFAVMALTSRHSYQVLTKRHGRMRALLNRAAFRLDVAEHATDLLASRPWQQWQLDLGGERLAGDSGLGGGWTVGKTAGGENLWVPPWPLPNVWLGVSVENQQWAGIRIPALLDTPAAVRFLSCEPLLGPVRLDVDLLVNDPPDGIGWVIAGGESGPGARPMLPAWPRAIRDSCAAARVPFFFKQWGTWAPTGAVGAGAVRPDRFFTGQVPGEPHGCGEEIARMGKHKAGRLLDGRTWDEFPRPAEAVARG